MDIKLIMRFIRFIIIIAFAFFIKGGGLSYAQTPSVPQSVYTLNPPPFSFPKDRTGGIKRSIAQFEDWFLICDEIRAEKKEVCNVTQAVKDENNLVVFSWTLATTQEGKPFMLLRTLPNADTEFAIKLRDNNSNELVDLSYVGCNDKTCMARMAINYIFSQEIDNGRVVQIIYKTKEGRVISMNLPLKGLKEAVLSVQ